jgi:hypothetical protein
MMFSHSIGLIYSVGIGVVVELSLFLKFIAVGSLLASSPYFSLEAL